MLAGHGKHFGQIYDDFSEQGKEIWVNLNCFSVYMIREKKPLHFLGSDLIGSLKHGFHYNINLEMMEPGRWSWIPGGNYLKRS